MALKNIVLNNIPQNTSLQVGDIAYYVKNVTSHTSTNTGVMGSNEAPVKLGKITKIRTNSITVETNDVLFAIDDFLMFSKDKSVNNSSLLGYYAEIKLANNSTEKAELFSIGSEVTPSSK